MADKSTFSAEEWNQLMQGVMAAGIAVTAADPSGLWGMLKEGMASSRALLGAKEGTGATPLSTAIVEAFERSEDRNAARDGLSATLKGAKPDEIKTRCIEAVRQAAAIVDAKAPADAAGFKSWLLQISQSVAEAAKEGGFMGFGGTPVSDAEKATVAEISGALKVA
ncbi:hypothetical protein OCK02_04695 (plasmid) [Rhizobium sp. TRM96647]|uniref:hypothetical protein n=1 Tax=unclassified Rhizobium TaxID=2613769 RepID=UPI001E5161F4|nr:MULTISPECIES: hypothetical protein [unclassified Rhizobium]MCD2180761.1 hypothetical protein [Rhizobium sp. GN54]MCV3735495.1 hypothetical protein [Rhizobium sp. TRM96647]MCV3757742.1 hypothetical protein [Rhizobium sp. TRM96650]